MWDSEGGGGLVGPMLCGNSSDLAQLSILLCKNVRKIAKYVYRLLRVSA